MDQEKSTHESLTDPTRDGAIPDGDERAVEGSVVMLDRSDNAPITYTSQDPTPPLPRREPQTGWLWACATFCGLLAAMFPLMLASKASSGLGPGALGLIIGGGLILRTPRSWRGLTAGVLLVSGCGWWEWGMLGDSTRVWAALPEATRVTLWNMVGRQLAWAVGASLGLGLFCKAPKLFAWLGGAFMLICVAGLASGFLV